MRLDRSFLALALVLLPLTAQAAEDDCPTALDSLITTALPGAVIAEDGYRIDQKTVAPRQIVCRRWPAHPDKLLVAMPLIDDIPDPQGFERSGDLQVLIFDHDTLTPRSHLLMPDFIRDDAISQRELRFDTAPYRLIEGRIAFGIRASYANSSQPNPASYELLWLFDPRGDDLVPVVEGLMVKQFGGEWDTRCLGEFHELSRILDLSPNSQNGAADITLITTQSSILSAPQGEDCVDDKTTTTLTDNLRYDGTRYGNPADNPDWLFR